MELEEEIQTVKNEIKRLKKEANKKNDKKDMDELEKALHKAIDTWKNNKDEETIKIKEERKKANWKRIFTFLLVLSRVLVFGCFMYVAMVMYQIDKPIESIIIVFATALYLILNRLDRGT